MQADESQRIFCIGAPDQPFRAPEQQSGASEQRFGLIPVCFWGVVFGWACMALWLASANAEKRKKPEKSLTRILLSTILMRSEVQKCFDIRTTFHSVSRDLGLASAFQQLRGQIRPGPREEDRWGREFLRGSLRGSCVEKSGWAA